MATLDAFAQEKRPRVTEPQTHALNIQQTLEQEILSGVLAPGARLEEVDLSARFNCSRTPVREALRQLAAASLITVKPRQPAVVAALSARKLIEMFQVMADLEGLCARLAARRISSAQIERLKQAHARMESLAQTDDVDLFYEINREFHEVIYEASQNEFLTEQTRSLRNRVAAYRKLVTQRPRRRTDTLTEHAAVLEAIVGGDEDKADKTMTAHVNLLGEKLLDFIALFPESDEAFRR
ncbi:transcriptional regulator [Variovorax paradoxus]|jgi:DNA-binding GntR family transcriptional regulator|nr:transcriptional regulator [Variovorax paradoxus]KPV07081.1 transcriptional regulator [Variovorax paradoxus]KPV09309.1 transcriptional regulator [Variovorax paradoxus]KPV21753.1 transcriptional regulator [Variovorax paradoxus]KPV31900.1 transcriptional regulator [Variovorax paradoxus]